MKCSELPDTLGFRIVHTGKLLLKTINVIFAGITKEITFEQMGVLYYISKKEGGEIIQQDLADIMDKNKSAILRSIDILEEKGYVKRIRVSEDRRKNLLEITTSGKAIIDKMHEIFLRQDVILKQGISEQDIATCMSVMEIVHEKCK
jgi:MarR family transcriptional repressor of mepA